MRDSDDFTFDVTTEKKTIEESEVYEQYEEDEVEYEVYYNSYDI